MTDKELLAMCQLAFESIPVAAKSRKMLNKLKSKPAPYAGNGSHILAGVLAKMIDDHLKGGI